LCRKDKLKREAHLIETFYLSKDICSDFLFEIVKCVLISFALVKYFPSLLVIAIAWQDHKFNMEISHIHQIKILPDVRSKLYFKSIETASSLPII